MTMLSRIMGFIRDMLLARLFGADAATDVFFVAFKIPNFLRRLFAEGAFSQAFVPVLAEYKEQNGKQALKQFVDRTGGALALVLIVLTVIGVAAAPIIILIFAPGFLWEKSGQYELAVDLLRLTFPYLFFISSVAFAGGILNTFGKFVVPAFTPVFLNLCLIGAAIWLAPLMNEPVMALAWGVFAAGIVQLLFQFPALMRLGLLPRLRFGFKDPGVKKIMSLMVPALFGASVTQINLLLDTLIASFLAAGSISWLYYSDRLVEFPLGVFGIALATVILPRLSKNYAANDEASFSDALDWGLRWVMIIGIPASVGLAILAEPMLSALFQYESFSDYDVVMAGRSLFAYALGLLGFVLVKILVPGFTARQDMKTPVRFGLYAVSFNMVLNICLVFPLAHAGLALATSLSAFLNAGLLLGTLLQHKIFHPRKGWGLFIARVVIANIAMGCVLYYFVDGAVGLDGQMGSRILELVQWIALGFLVYLLTLLLFGLRFRHLGGRV
ncbi:MAG TPA: murein biosynthesis integral membrane protein MurJ [Methylococcaceae bacterium]|nr:murein biosynthesis integral membrane protein MurJ [Methylococcaceae bacterium]HIL38843.1 murein biosynthesis integral membrane protein MurJ [Methylococcales bacterium]